MRRVSLLWLLVALVSALVVAGCGGDDEGGSGGADAPNTGAGGATVGEGKQGGTLSFLTAGDVDYMDPGQTYYSFAYQINYAVNRPLYSFKPDDEEPDPDLAEGMPEIADDNKSITVKLKTGVKFSPPVDREVTSKDVKYAIERAFTTNVPSGYSTSYFAEIKGAPASPVAISKLKPFEGLKTPDDQTLVIELTKPVAPRVAAALVMPITMPVPEEYARKFDEKNPTEYDQYVAFTGPYMVKNDESGKLVGRDPGKRIELVRNPNWDKNTDYRPAFLDSITIEEGNDDLTVASRRTLSGQGLICCDSGQPPISILKRASERFEDQIGRTSAGGTRWIAMNSTVKPFDNVNVRRALFAAFDRDALRLTRGGEFIGPIAQGFIPPGIPGFEESGGEEGFTDVDFTQNPKGDMELAKKYMLEAKKDGVPVSADGKYTGGEEFLAIASNADPGAQTAQVAQGEFEKLGFKLNLRKVPQDTLYTKFCGVPKANVAICPNVGWFRDFNDPESLLLPTFSGKAIKPAGNVNWTQLDDPEINEAMDKASVLTDTERNQAWADINKQIVEQAAGIPYSWDDNVQLAAKDVSAPTNPYLAGFDLSFTSLK
jgi:peptide/nickel transport system substrate-binding protein